MGLMQPGPKRKLVTAGVMMGMFLSALEATAVAAAMPTAVGDLGGVDRYSWVFSAYLLTATTTVPMYGKLADLFGRRKIYLVGVTFFLLGSAFCGVASTFEALIGFRALQGLGAGGLQPVAITVVGDVFTLEERGRMQGILSGVWAVSSLIGPLVGGLVTDFLSWRFVFYLAIPFGLVSAFLLWTYLEETVERREHKLDVAGTLLLSVAVAALLFALTEGGGSWGFADPRTLILLGVFGVGLVLFVFQERRAPEPMLPLDLFRHPVIATAAFGNVLMGAMLFAVTAFLPVMAQGALGGTAKDAGLVLAPALVSWPIASTLSARFMFRTGYRKLALLGAGLVLVSAVLFSRIGPGTTLPSIMVAVFIVGLGLGAMSIPYLLGVQNAVPWRRRGVATSSVQFFRSIGGAISVAALGAILGAHLGSVGLGDLDPNAVLQPELRASLTAESLQALQSALLGGLHEVYQAVIWIAVAGVVVALAFPAAAVRDLAHREG